MTVRRVAAFAFVLALAVVSPPGVANELQNQLWAGGLNQSSVAFLPDGRRVRSTLENAPPIAVAAATPGSGPAPLSVAFSSDGSFDTEGSPISYAWDFGDGQASIDANPIHVYAINGVYTVRLTVSDGDQQTVAKPLTVRVGRPPVLTLAQPMAGTTVRAGDTVQVHGWADDPDEGPLPPASLSWAVVLHHDSLRYPFLGPTTGGTGRFVVPSSGPDGGGTWSYEVIVTATDADGLSTSASAMVLSHQVAVTGVTGQNRPGAAVNGAAASTDTAPTAPARPTGAAPAVAESLTVSYPVINSLDDVNEVNSTFDAFATTVWVGTGGSASASYAGLRFALDIPPGSTITSARLELNAAQTQWLSIGFDIGIENSGSAAPFTDDARPSSRTLAAARLAHVSDTQWLVGAWYSVGEVGPLLQAVVNRADWTTTSAAAFVLKGTIGTWGRKFAHSLDGSPLQAPRLVVTYVPAEPPPPPPPPPTPSGFSNNKVLIGFDTPTSLNFTPDGRMLVTERAGRVRVTLPGRTNYEPVPFLQLANIEATVGERALVNLALDPAFATNGHYYVFYTQANPLRDVVSRFTAVGNTTDLATEVVIYQDPGTSSDIHHGGGLAFGADGRLYIATGDGHDTQPGLSHASQLLTSPRGKVLRLNADGTVPPDNPFHDGPGGNLDAIWALGLRNPFRMSVDATTGQVHLYDVGGGAWEEVNVLVPGANYGWPICEGGCATAGTTGPLFAYSHQGRDAAVGGGVVYRGTTFPESHQGNLFYGDFVQSWIRRLTLSSTGSVLEDLPFEPADGAADGPTGNVVDLDVGPDGALYYVNIGGGAIHRISHFSDNRPPEITTVSATPTSGTGIPFVVQFAVAASDPEGQALTYTWEFGDGTTSAQEDPQHLYQTTGSFAARVLVSDGTLTTFSEPLTITVGSPPTASISSPPDGTTFRAGETVAFTGAATDPDEELPGSAFSWTVVFHHDTHTHPGFGPFTGETGSFVVPTTGHDFSGDTAYELVLSVTDAQGLSATDRRFLEPEKVDLTLTTDPPGLQVSLDATSQGAPLTKDVLVGFTHSVATTSPQQLAGVTYEFTGWSDGGAITHAITAPPANQVLVGTFRPVSTLAVSSAEVTEGDAGVASLTFVVTLSPASTQPVAASFTTADGTATAGADYTAATGLVTFAPGEVSRVVTVGVVGDTDTEADETLTLTLSNPTGGATIGGAPGLGTIVDDDAPPLTMAIGDLAAGEGSSGPATVLVPVTLSAPAATTVSAHYVVTAGTATAGADFTAAAGTVTFTAGQAAVTIPVTILGDTLDEPDETLTVDLSGPIGAALTDAQGVLTIVDDDAAPAISVSDIAVAESAASVTVTLSLSAASGRPVSVTAATADLTATTQDYAATTVAVSWTAGQTTRTITVPIVADVLDEPDETFTVALNAPVNAVVGDGSAVVTITDDDPAPVLTIADVSVPEGNTGSTAAAFTVTLSAASAKVVTVGYTTANGTATSADYTAASGILTFAPGVTTQTVTVAVIGDVAAEGDETFLVTLNTPTNAGLSDGQAVATIVNDDALPVLAIGNASIGEGNSGSRNLTFTVTLTPASPSAVTVGYATAPLTATADVDYLTRAGTLSFSAGVTSRTFTVPVLGDAIAEVDETFAVNLSGAVNATIGGGAAVATIVDNDAEVAVTAPNSTLTWTIGSSRSITWSHNLGAGAAMRVELTRNNGATWETLAAPVAATGATTGAFTWVVTGPATTTARIRVVWLAKPSVADQSNKTFRIQ